MSSANRTLELLCILLDVYSVEDVYLNVANCSIDTPVIEDFLSW